MTGLVRPWEAVFETPRGIIEFHFFGTIKIDQAGTLRMRNEAGKLHPTFFVCVKEGDKLTYNERPVKENGYLDGWPPFPRRGQTYVTVTLLESGFEMSFIDGNTQTKLAFKE
jgi:hypothetical protein